jgi:hypothetical protein
MTKTILAPIELNDDELLAVSGGSASAHASSAIVQAISQSVGAVQSGGNFSVGGNGATTVTNSTFTHNPFNPPTTITNDTGHNASSASASASASATAVM